MTNAQDPSGYLNIPIQKTPESVNKVLKIENMNKTLKMVKCPLYKDGNNKITIFVPWEVFSFSAELGV